MATDHLHEEALSGIARQVGRILALDHSAFPSEEPVEIRESFPVWTVSPDAVTHPDRDSLHFSLVATPLDRWYHQLAFGGKPGGYAISVEREPGLHRVLEVMKSSLAEKVDTIVGWIDERSPDTDCVRLLDVEPNYLHALWLIGGKASDNLVVVNAPASLKLKTESFIPSREFLAKLADFWNEHEAMGLVGATVPTEIVGVKA